ncbi:MAG: tRNA (adenosine(37)-N6)-threonylcarbamoyltransferase complex dimerization subunit type 1 TsaB [Chloroflexi bacterium]|nr:tRNA (adenosine(37)-N6)-threonylcarbamoyltransferase complex dimerization subunit type 1 TsaB [Chloroflexota bacterium]
MTLLAIDTAGRSASVAVFDGRAVLAEETWRAQQHSDDHLFAAIERVLALATLSAADLRFVAACRGPGSFTGVRVGIAAAQGIARAAGARVVGVGTLDAIAHPFRGTSRVCALIPAGRGEHHAAVYRSRGGAWQRVLGILTLSIADLAPLVMTGALFAGEIDDATRAEIVDRLDARAQFPPASMSARRAGHLAELAWIVAQAGGAIAPEALEPVYLRPPGIRGPTGVLVARSEPSGRAGGR